LPILSVEFVQGDRVGLISASYHRNLNLALPPQDRDGCGSPSRYESQPSGPGASPMAGTPLREPWSAQMRRRPERRPLTRPDHTEFGPLRPGDLRRSGSGRAPRMLARQWVRRLCGRYHCRPIETVHCPPPAGTPSQTWSVSCVLEARWRLERARSVVTR